MLSPVEERLIGSGMVTPDQLAHAHAEGRLSGKSFWSHLVRAGFLSEGELARFLGRQLRVAFVEVGNYLVDPRVLALVDEALARRHLLLPLFLVDDVLFVAMANPGNVVAIDEVHARTRLAVEPLMTTASELREALDQYYGIEDVFGTTLEYVEVAPDSRLTSADTRQHPRVLLTLPLAVAISTPGVTPRGPQPIAGQLVNISLGGAMVELPWFLPRGTRIRIQLQVLQPGRAPIQVSGKVLHCQARVLTSEGMAAGGQRLSVQFVDLDPQTQTAIAGLVNAAAAA